MICKLILIKKCGKKKLYIKNNLSPYPLNRTKIGLFFDCKKCFYLDLKKRVRRPYGPPLVLNNTINQTVKSDFNRYRKSETPHPIMGKFSPDLIPANHSKLESWRNPLIGVRYLHRETNLQLSGIINDLWLNIKEDKLLLDDYKFTSKKEEINEKSFWSGHWKQLSFYKYLLDKQKLKMSPKGIIILFNEKKNSTTFDKKLEFSSHFFSNFLDTSWVESEIIKIYVLLQSDSIPSPSTNCKYYKYCKYISIVNKVS